MTQDTNFTPSPEPILGDLTFPKYMVNPNNDSIILALTDGTGVVVSKGTLPTLPERINNTQGYIDAIGTIVSTQDYPVIG